MADTSEAIALRFRDFIQSADLKASSFMPQGIRSEMRRGAPKPRILEIYEECLSKLKVDERGEFDRMIKKMSGAFGSPPGALIPQ
jgi:hypothetical protein